MIKYNLKCHNSHEFESWFANSKEFDNLNKKKLLSCIYCSSNKIGKSIMAPMVSNTKKKKKTIYGTTTIKERKELNEEGIDLISVPWINKDN